MKFSLRTIALVVTLIMTVVFIYQIYWLRGLYITSGKQLEKNILEAMGIADQNELFARIERVKDGKDNISIGANVEEDSTGNQTYYSTHKRQDSISFTNNSKDKKEFSVFKESAKTTEKLAAYLQTNLHKAIDTIIPADFNRYDSLLAVELAKSNIYRPYRIVIVQALTDSVCDSIPGQETVSFRHAKKYDYLFDMYGKHIYRLYLNHPNKQVFTQMTGILSTSVVIFALLIYVFIYLLRTIYKLQTEEELKTNFTNNMTHELKTPIAVSYAAVDALLVSGQPANLERQQKYLTIAKEQMLHLTGLVEQILSMSRTDNKHIELKPEEINLNDIVTSLIEKLRLLSDKEIHFETDLKNLTVIADKMHLYNMLNNLIENGIKYSGDKVLIKIKAFKGTDGVSVSVEDNGPGIDPKYQSRIFDKFYRIPTGNLHDVKGYGLGLFYVKEMTGKHGGTISLKSQPGKGSIFTLKFPNNG